MLLINNQEVADLFDMKSCLEALETGYADLLKGDAVYRPRLDVWVPCERPDGYYRWGTMEGASREIGVFAIRMKSDIVHWPDGKTEEKYCTRPGTYCGLIMVFSVRNGEPLAILNDGLLQHMRVGGCAGLGAKYLARPDASVVGILGSGGMAGSYLEAFNEVRKIRKVKVYSPTRAHREAYAAEMSRKLGLSVEAVDSPEAVVRGSHIVLDHAVAGSGLLLQSTTDRRVFFVLPWKGTTLVGTTEVVQEGPPDLAHASAEEVEYLIQRFNRYFRTPIAQSDVQAAFAGVRPLVGRATNPSAIDRDSRVVRQGNVINVFGGKMTTFMALARKVALRADNYFGRSRDAKEAVFEAAALESAA